MITFEDTLLRLGMTYVMPDQSSVSGELGTASNRSIEFERGGSGAHETELDVGRAWYLRVAWGGPF
jgi:hypothetical protein